MEPSTELPEIVKNLQSRLHTLETNIKIWGGIAGGVSLCLGISGGFLFHGVRKLGTDIEAYGKEVRNEKEKAIAEINAARQSIVDDGTVGLLKKSLLSAVSAQSGSGRLGMDNREPWLLAAGSGSRRFSERVRFSREFEKPPTVLASVSGFSWEGDGHFQILATDVDKLGFDLVFEAIGDSKIKSISFTWIAFPSTSVEPVSVGNKVATP